MVLGEPGPADDREEGTSFQKSLTPTSKDKERKKKKKKDKERFSVYEAQDLDAQHQTLGCAWAYFRGKQTSLFTVAAGFSYFLEQTPTIIYCFQFTQIPPENIEFEGHRKQKQLDKNHYEAENSIINVILHLSRKHR